MSLPHPVETATVGLPRPNAGSGLGVFQSGQIETTIHVSPCRCERWRFHSGQWQPLERRAGGWAV